MSLPAQNVAPQIVAAAGQTVFPFSWRCDDSLLVQVYVNDAVDGGFTVIRNADQTASPGGTITRAFACVGGEVVTVERLSPLTQTTAFTKYGPFPADSVTTMVDKFVMLSQEASSILGKCIKIARSQLSKLSSFEFPAVVAGQALAFVADPLDASKVKLGLLDVAAYVNQQLSGFPAVQPLSWVFVGDGATLDFNILGALVSSSDVYLVTVDGVPQPPAAYTVSLTGTPQIHFGEAPPFNAACVVRSLSYAKAASIGDATLVLAAGSTTPRALNAWMADQVNVKAYGAKGDNATDDSLAVARARVASAAGGGVLFFPPGTYLLDATALASAATQNLYVRGSGMERTILKSIAGGDVIHIDTANAYIQRIEIGSLTIAGAGVTDPGLGKGISIQTGTNVINQLNIHDVSVRDCGGKGIFIATEFCSMLENVMVDNCGDNLFDLSGGNTTTLKNCYAQRVRTGKVGYRMHTTVVMISCNGINNTWGAANQDQADWGCFGDELFTAWAQNTAYTIGQLRSANGNEYEVITPGTSNVAGIGPTTISADITDGTVHWRHIGTADAANRYFVGTLLNCNVEAPTRSGIRLKANSSIVFHGGRFQPPIGAPGGAAGLIGLWVGFIDPQQVPILLDGQATANLSFTAFEHGSLIHFSAGGASIIRLGGTSNAPGLWHRQNNRAMQCPVLTGAGNGTAGAALLYEGIFVSPRLVVNNGPLVRTQVNPVYGANVTIDPTLGDIFEIQVTDANAMTIKNPGAGGTAGEGIAKGMRITVRVKNQNAGAMGATTWGTLYRLALGAGAGQWANPVGVNSRTVDFEYDGTNWIQQGAVSPDFAN